MNTVMSEIETINEKVCRYARTVIPLDDGQTPSSFDEIKDKPEYSYLREMIELAITEDIAEEREANKVAYQALKEMFDDGEEFDGEDGWMTGVDVSLWSAGQEAFEWLESRAAPKAEVSQ